MKKLFILLFVALAGMTAASAQSTGLGALLGRLAGGSSASDSTATSSASSGLGGMLGNLLSNVLSNDNVAISDMVGTWKYSSPAVAFESDDLLGQAGGAAAAAALEEKLVSYYKKIGFDGMTLTVNADSTFTMKSKRLSLGGTLAQGEEPGQILFQFKALRMISIGTYTAHVAILSDRMTVTFDTTKLMTLVNSVASFAGSKSLSTLNSLLQQFDGMEAGYNLTKTSD